MPRLERAADAGLFGPRSASWRIDREVMVLAGGTCALLMQLAHPAVAAGVAQHSDFRADPFARLRRTLDASYAVVFGTASEARRAVARINAIHAAVAGTVPETGERYAARDPHLLLWVHATLVDTALRVTDQYVRRLAASEMEAYYDECRIVALALGIPAGRLPPTLTALRAWMADMVAGGEVAVGPTARALAPSVLYPASVPPRIAWDAANLVSLSVMPDPIRRGYGIRWSPARERGMERLSAVSRRLLPLVPGLVRHMPYARRADRRVRRTGDDAARRPRAAISPTRSSPADQAAPSYR